MRTNKPKTASCQVLFLFIFSLLFCASASAQKDSTSVVSNPLFVRLSYQLLHSTHATNFNGVSADINKNLSKNFSLGIGLQYAATRIHPDNGWTLTKLRLFPVYINTIYTFLPTHRLQPYIHTEEGISFNRYNKLDTTVSPTPYKVSEAGLYLSGNVGLAIKIAKHFRAFTEIGYKGYKHSTNELDVNPHGFTARVGIEL